MIKIFELIIYAASVIVAAGTITGFAMKWLNSKLGELIDPIQKQIHKMDVKESRRVLIDFLVDVENGIDKNEVQRKFAHDVYDHYVNDLGENSYVKDFWERMVK